MSKKLLYNFATRSRPLKVIACLDNITAMALHDNYEISLTCDLDDSSMCNDEMRDKINSYPNTKVYYGTSKNKVDAINKNVNLCPDFDIVLTHSDDFVITKAGFDLQVLDGYENFSGLLHFPDQIAKERLITYPIMDRAYYNLDGYIYHPDFANVYCDNFQHYVAQKRGLYKFVNKEYLRHEHAIWGYGVMDELLKKTEEPEGYKRDNVIMERLKKEFNEADNIQ